MESCASTNTIAALLAGAASPAAAERLEVHLDACAACRRLVADLGRGLSAIGETRPGALAHGLPRPGECIGRYEVKRVIGVGGMGVVYEAHDTTLDRGVALKLLRPDLLESPSLLAEAQAMARLQHPHIAAVHDAGIANGRLFVCMELVAGSTLRAWVAAASRSWREIVDVYIAAGEGLAYVHRAGLVHLDFKPDNVLVDRDGRVRVTDFGLARIIGASPAGAIVGTPAYMAPEQRTGRPTDARSDQFAFCVSLREALGATPAPRWLQRVLERGTAVRPDDRFATMDDLLAAIAGGLAPRSRRVAALAVVATTGLVTLAAVLLPSPSAGPTRMIERPVMRTVTEYRDLARAPSRVTSSPASTLPAVAPGEAREVAVAVARAFAPPRASPPLHVASIPPTALASVAAAAAAGGRASNDPAQPPSIGVGYCDDGAPLTCGWWAPSCPAGTLLAIQQGCWTCADAQTCGPLGFPRACNDGTPLRCNQPPPACSDGRVAAVRKGCWSCEDPFRCWSRVPQPTYPPPRPPPRPRPENGSSSGSSSGSDTGATCGNGFCEVGEHHASCASDCCEADANGACAAVCGNAFCEAGEDHASCADDCCELSGSGGCAAVCGNGFCEDGESAASCPGECS